MSATATPIYVPRELNERTGDGMTVKLFWDPSADQCYVSVVSEFETFIVMVHEGQKPMDVFNHPFAYR